MRQIFNLLFVTSFLAFAFFTVCFSAETTSQEEWDPSSAGPAVGWTAPLCGKGKFVIQPYFFNTWTRGTFNDEGHEDSLPEGDKQFYSLQQLFLQYGITDAFEVDFQTEYQENYVTQGDAKAHSKGFGDSYFYARYCLLEEKAWLPHITGLFQLKIPTGKYQHADPDKLGTDLRGATSGGGSWEEGAGFILTKKIKPFILHFDATYSIPNTVQVDGIKTLYAHNFNYNAAVEYFLPHGFNLLLELNGFIQGDKKEDGTRTPASDIRYTTICPGIGWSNDTIQTLICYQRVVAGTNINADDTVVATFIYTF